MEINAKSVNVLAQVAHTSEAWLQISYLSENHQSFSLCFGMNYSGTIEFACAAKPRRTLLVF